MRILLTNDDAYYAQGIRQLHAALKKICDVHLVAPSREQSAISHALTLNHPLRIHKLGDKIYSVDGTPADCVLLGIHALRLAPDLVIAGINHGPNMGEDVIYSGTVAAAREGALMGIPALAVSVAGRTNCKFQAATRFVTRLVKHLARRRVSPGYFLNINVPNCAPARVTGWDVTRLGKRTYRNLIEHRKDPRGHSYYWISGQAIWKKETGTDYNAVEHHRISVTPLSLEMTDFPALAGLSALLKEKIGV